LKLRWTNRRRPASELLESKSYELYADAAPAVRRTKEKSFKSAVVTTIAHFKFEKAVQTIRGYLDFAMTGYEAGCDKSNPEMYRKVLEVLHVKPEEAVMIGDEMQLDVLLPKQLGMKAILLDRTGKMKRRGGHFDYAIVYNLNDAVETVIRQSGKS
jgi:FMN phosphatase YigB (HAD superfamily)